MATRSNSAFQRPWMPDNTRDAQTFDGPGLLGPKIGNGGNNTLIADAGNDLLLGLGGMDTLIATTGRDILIGGADADTYVIDEASTGLKIIFGFEEGVDILDLTDFDDIYDIRQLDVIEDTWGTLIRLENATIFLREGYLSLTDETKILLSPDPVFDFDDLGPVTGSFGADQVNSSDYEFWQTPSTLQYFDKTIKEDIGANDNGNQWITKSGDFAAIAPGNVTFVRSSSQFDEPFDFKSVSLTALNRDGLVVNIIARNDDGDVIAGDAVIVSAGSYTDYVADPLLFDEISQLEFTSSGGTPADPQGSNTSAFLMDDLVIF